MRTMILMLASMFSFKNDVSGADDSGWCDNAVVGNVRYFDVGPGVRKYLDAGGNWQFEVDEDLVVKVGDVDKVARLQARYTAAIQRGNMTEAQDIMERLLDAAEDAKGSRGGAPSRLPATPGVFQPLAVDDVLRSGGVNGLVAQAPYSIGQEGTRSGAGTISFTFTITKPTTLRHIEISASDTTARVTSINIDGDEFQQGAGGRSIAAFAPGTTNPIRFDRAITQNTKITIVITYVGSGDKTGNVVLAGSNPFLSSCA